MNSSALLAGNCMAKERNRHEEDALEPAFSYDAPTGVVLSVAAWAHGEAFTADSADVSTDYAGEESTWSSRRREACGLVGSSTERVGDLNSSPALTKPLDGVATSAAWAPQQQPLQNSTATPRLFTPIPHEEQARELNRRRVQVSVEKQLVEQDRMKLEALLAKYRSVSFSPVRDESTPRAQTARQCSSTSPPRTPPPAAPTAHLGQPEQSPREVEVVFQTDLSPILPPTFDDRSPSSSPRQTSSSGGGTHHPAMKQPAHRLPQSLVSSPSSPLACETRHAAPTTPEQGPTARQPQPPNESNHGNNSKPVSQQLSPTDAKCDASAGEVNDYFSEKLKQIARLRERNSLLDGVHRPSDEDVFRTRRRTVSSPLEAFCARGKMCTPALTRPTATRMSGNGVSLNVASEACPLVERRPCLRWDAERSGNVLLSADGFTCLSDGERAWQLALAEYGNSGDEGGQEILSRVSIPLYALGTVGVATGDFVFQIRFGCVAERSPDDCRGQTLDAHGSAAPPYRFAVGVTTEHFRGPERVAVAYLYCSNGTSLCDTGAGLFRGGAEEGEAALADERPAASSVPRLPYGVPFGPGDDVAVVLQLSRGLLSFCCNGVPLGPAFRFVAAAHPEPLFPVVLFTQDEDVATFTKPALL